jgi:amidohydrolase
MPMIERIVETQRDITAWRHILHQTPELLFDVEWTAAFITEKLKSFGCDTVTNGIGRTGVVARIAGRGGGDKSIALRADMDALPIREQTDLPYRSTIPGQMHACGHDGHMAMLLGAARYLADTRNFNGTAVIVFQPAEETGGGARVMIEDGLMEKFGIDEVFGLHNMPGTRVGVIETRTGVLLGSSDTFEIIVSGRGGHAARPHEVADPIVGACQIVSALNTIVSRNIDPLDSVVVSVTAIGSGDAFNVIPEQACIRGTLRALNEGSRKFSEERLTTIAKTVAEAFNLSATLNYRREYPSTVNPERQSNFAAEVACDVVGRDNVNPDTHPILGAEDFAFMLQERPGAYVFLGNGDTAPLHSPHYDFNDTLLPIGASYFATLIERRLTNQ